MALWQKQSPLRHLFGSVGAQESELRRLKEKHESLTHATQEWLTLLRDMEHNGESGGSQYERYYQAYLRARQQQKDIDLRLFNYRRGLLG